MLKALIRHKRLILSKPAIDCVEETAKEKGVSMGSVAIVWCLNKDSVNTTIGLSSKGRTAQAVEAVKFTSSGRSTAEDVAYVEEDYALKVVQGY